MPFPFRECELLPLNTMMKLFNTSVLSISVSLVLVGCAETHQLMTDSTHRVPTQSIDVLTDGQQPSQPTRAIAELSYKGSASDELKAKRYLIRHAEKLGGQAVALSRNEAGDHITVGFWGGFGGATKDIDYLYKAVVLIYQ